MADVRQTMKEKIGRVGGSKGMIRSIISKINNAFFNAQIESRPSDDLVGIGVRISKERVHNLLETVKLLELGIEGIDDIAVIAINTLGRCKYEKEEAKNVLETLSAIWDGGKKYSWDVRMTARDAVLRIKARETGYNPENPFANSFAAELMK